MIYVLQRSHHITYECGKGLVFHFQLGEYEFGLLFSILMGKLFDLVLGHDVLLLDSNFIRACDADLGELRRYGRGRVIQ